MEQWKAIKGYEGLYEVSDAGKVRSLKFGKVKELSLVDNGLGYLFVSLYKEGKCKMFQIHRLVVEAFIGEIPKGLIVNHKDENSQNNNVNNLEICTYEYNNNYGTRNDRVRVTMKGKTPWNKGKQLSSEHRAKISASMKVKKKALFSALKN